MKTEAVFCLREQNQGGIPMGDKGREDKNEDLTMHSKFLPLIRTYTKADEEDIDNIE